MKLIVAVDKKWAIGYKNELLASIPCDQRFFREQTTGNVIIMGRKTLESFPGKKPLKNRTNIVITKQKDYQVADATVVHSVEEALEFVRDLPTDQIFVVGGASIYEQMEPFCDTALVTKIKHTYEADTFFPNLDEKPEWKMVSSSEEQIYNDLEYCFTMYKKYQI